MNESFYPNLDVNFAQACELCEQIFSHEELLYFLQNGNIPQKQIAALKFDTIKTSRDAQVLLGNLIGCDGKIREAIALKINQILTEDILSRKILAELSGESFAHSTIDINGNICRLTVDSAILLKDFTSFSSIYVPKILSFVQEALNELDNFIFRDKKYIINKQLFKLYWCLETLKNFYTFIPNDTLIPILLKCANQKEYTIREKTAQIAILSPEFEIIQQQLINDNNYYVREVFKQTKTNTVN